MDVLETVEPIQHQNDLEILSKVSRKESRSSTSLRRAPCEKWSSNLAPQDLRCLLAVLEAQLIPKLIHDYSPARSTPLAVLDADG